MDKNILKYYWHLEEIYEAKPVEIYMEIVTNSLIIVGNLYNTLSGTCDQVDQKFSQDIEDFEKKKQSFWVL